MARVDREGRSCIVNASDIREFAFILQELMVDGAAPRSMRGCECGCQCEFMLT